jgi:hypothetical protein
VTRYSPDANAKKWSERPVRIIALAVVSGLIVWLAGWLISRHFDRPTPATATQSPHQLQPAQPAPTSTTATTPPSQAVRVRTPPSQLASAHTSGQSSPAVGSLTLGPGSAVSFGQQGGITAGTVNIGAVARHLTPQQIEGLAHVSIPSSGKLGVLTCEDSDSQIFAHEIYIAIDPKNESRWYDVAYARVPPLPRGVYIGARDKDQRKALSSTLERIKNILNTADTPVNWLEDASLAPGDLEIIVGPR